MMTKLLSTSFDGFYERIREILEVARIKVYRTANIEMLQAYWNVGREIVEEEQKGRDRAGYGSFTRHLKKSTHCVENYPGHTTVCC